MQRFKVSPVWFRIVLCFLMVGIPITLGQGSVSHFSYLNSSGVRIYEAEKLLDSAFAESGNSSLSDSTFLPPFIKREIAWVRHQKRENKIDFYFVDSSPGSAKSRTIGSSGYSAQRRPYMVFFAKSLAKEKVNGMTQRAREIEVAITTAHEALHLELSPAEFQKKVIDRNLHLREEARVYSMITFEGVRPLRRRGVPGLDTGYLNIDDELRKDGDDPYCPEFLGYLATYLGI